jgi:hypothetical protein
MVITRVNALSVAKVAAVVYAGIGLIAGLLFALIGRIALGAALAGVEGAGGGLAARDGVGLAGAFFGVGAIIIMPICYAVLGFIGSFIAALIFNFAAGITGGIEVETR